MRPSDDSGKNLTEGDPFTGTSLVDIAQLRERIDTIDDEIIGASKLYPEV